MEVPLPVLHRMMVRAFSRAPRMPGWADSPRQRPIEGKARLPAHSESHTGRYRTVPVMIFPKLLATTRHPHIPRRGRPPFDLLLPRPFLLGKFLPFCPRRSNESTSLSELVSAKSRVRRYRHDRRAVGASAATGTIPHRT